MKPKLKISQIVGTEECIPCKESKNLTTLCPTSKDDIYRVGVTFWDLIDIIKRNNIDPKHYDNTLSDECLSWINEQLKV